MAPAHHYPIVPKPEPPKPEPVKPYVNPYRRPTSPSPKKLIDEHPVLYEPIHALEKED